MSPSPDAAGTVEAKVARRTAMRQRRGERSTDRRQREDQQRFDRLVEQLTDRVPSRLAAYLSAGTEPDSWRFVAWAVTEGIHVLLPVLTDGRGRRLQVPAWAPYEGRDRLRSGRSGILEPIGSVLPGDPLSGVDLMIVPGLAADLTGNRLGRGGGWYDRARADHPELETWLLLNDDEVIEVVPAEAWDLPVHRLITPTRVITTRPVSRA
ncbi:MAG TPA: 5-formyltetrahydrofolate cyclo-ligase [Microlunatus sp.]|nr:5-formyltetrahydrofolate cyclo-ligase [Microlunatus sp.]